MKRRPLLWVALCYIIGIIIAYNFYLNIYLIILFALASLMASLLIISYKKDCTYILMLLILFLGMLGSSIRLQNSDLSVLEDYQDLQVYVIGTVMNRPIEENNKTTFDIKTSKISGDGESYFEISKNLRVSNYTKYGKGEKAVSYGDEVKLYGKLIKPESQRNPGGFDYLKYLDGKGISASMAVYGDNIEFFGRGMNNTFKSISYKLAGKLQERVYKTFNEDRAGMMCALLFGYKHMIDRQTHESFIDGGVAHVLAVSGLHIGFIVLALFYVLNGLRVKSNYSFIIITIILILYILITGSPPSVVRASMMIWTILVAKLLGRKSDIITSIAIAALVILILNPLDLFNVGFQLSFIATLSIVLFYSKLKVLFKVLPKWLCNSLAVSVAAQLGILPITASYFNSISVISFISNILVVPIAGIVVITGFFLCTLGSILPFLWSLLVVPMNLVLDFLIMVVGLLASIPFASIRTITPGFYFIALYYLLLFYVFGYIRLKLNNRKIIVFTSILVFIITSIFVLSGNTELTVTFLDVGQGDAVFIKTPGNIKILIDGGGNYIQESGFEVGEDIVVPFLLDQGVRKLDFIMISHIHRDHIGGLEAVLDNIKVDKIFSSSSKFSNNDYNSLLIKAMDKGVSVMNVEKGDRIELKDGTVLDILHPSQNLLLNTPSDLNNNSMVVRLTYSDLSILFTGDVEKEAIQQILGTNEDISATLLKVPHHGSSSSYNDEFLERVNPQFAVIQVGKNNKFGHPNKEVVENYTQKGVEIFRTDINGAVMLQYDGNIMKIYSLR